MREKRDIVFLCQFFHPEYISSAQLPFDTAKALQKAGLSVDVICGYPKEYYTGAPVPREETLEGIRIHRLKRGCYYHHYNKQYQKYVGQRCNIYFRK